MVVLSNISPDRTTIIEVRHYQCIVHIHSCIRWNEGADAFQNFRPADIFFVINFQVPSQLLFTTSLSVHSHLTALLIPRGPAGLVSGWVT